MNPQEKLFNHVKNMTKIGIALTVEKDINKFFKMVLDAAMSFTNCDGGTIYTLSEDGNALDFKIICTFSMNLELGVADTASWHSVPLYDENKNPIYKNFSSYVAHTRKACSVEDAYHQDIFDNSGTINYDKNHDYYSKSMAAIPMLDHEEELLGVIQLINPLDEEGNIIAFTDDHLSTLTSLASLAAVALTNRKLIEGLENLLMQFIKSIANAIDHKSKYTGGHINRVAHLSEKIAQSIQEDKGFYQKVKFSEDELQELNIAGWMHDIGKITTPIHIRDKSTKLETICDRIKLVEMRFEIIEIILKEKMIQTRDRNIREKLQKDLENLESDKEFITRVNFGGEYLSKEDFDRIKRIADFSYNFHGKKYILITPEEAKNLAIEKGTLLPEEKDIIDEHALITHEMLNALTYPKKFKNVPQYASEHHEKLNGSGYPFHKKAQNIPLQSRIIALADIYEALTASDRPYIREERARTLTDALKILAYMVNDGEIDAHLLDLLLDSGLYMIYAKEFLQPTQIDNVDIKTIKSIYHS